MRECTIQVLLEGLQVDYYSQVFQCWAPAVVQAVDHDTGDVTLNCRNQPLSRKEAEAALRPRTRPGKKHLDWVRRVLRDGLVESEALKLFERHATRAGPCGAAALAPASLGAVGEDVDGLLGVSGSVRELRRRADKAGRGARPELPAGWELCRSADTGRDYYCSAESSQWQHPGGAAALDAEAFVAVFWEMLGAINRKWGQVFMLKEDRVRDAEEMHKEYAFSVRGEAGAEKRECLGTGTFGAVYLAKHRRTGIQRAVKEVPCRREHDAVLDRLDSEIGRLRALDHPHVVRLYDCYRDGDALFLCMDYCSGGDLAAYTERLAKAGQSIAEDTLRGIARQVLSAVAHIHARGLLHLDIKPGNVVTVPETRTLPPGLGPDPEQAAGGAQGPLHVMLIDLGLAQLFRPGAYRTGRCVGTPATMAPEVWRGVETPAADVFSTGCTLYFLLAGGDWPFRYPPPWRDEAKAYWAARPRRAAYPRAAPRAPRALCDAMLHRNRLRRPAVAQCLQDDFLLGPRGLRHGACPAVDARLRRLAKAPSRSLLYLGVALAVASEWPSHRLPSVRRAFEELDVAGTGRLQKAQIARTLISLGHDKDISYKAADAMDLSRDGMVDWTEFVAACVQLGDTSLEEDLWEVFEEADADRDGFLDRQDIARLLPLQSPHQGAVDDVMRQLLGPGAPAGPAARVDFARFRGHFASISVDRSQAEA